LVLAYRLYPEIEGVNFSEEESLKVTVLLNQYIFFNNNFILITELPLFSVNSVLNVSNLFKQ